MSYKLVNTQTGESHICEKIEKDGFDYYVNDSEIPTDAKYIAIEENPRRFVIYSKCVTGTLGSSPKLIIFSNEPSFFPPGLFSILAS